jgi:hypothetical protein
VPLKAAMEKLGRDSGALRLPMCRISKIGGEAIDKLLAAQGLRRAVVSV